MLPSDEQNDAAELRSPAAWEWLVNSRNLLILVVGQTMIALPEQEQPGYSGMMLNERLFAAGLLDAFDDAARRRDRSQMIDLLRRVEVKTPEWSVNTILDHPEKYGF